MNRISKGTSKTSDAYVEDVAKGKRFELHLGDCVEVVRRIESDSVWILNILSALRIALHLLGQRPRHGEFQG